MKSWGILRIGFKLLVNDKAKFTALLVTAWRILFDAKLESSGQSRLNCIGW